MHFSVQRLIAQTAAGMAIAIHERAQDPSRHRLVPIALAEQLILALIPGDVAQAILASQIILISELLKDCLAPREGTSAEAAHKQMLQMNRALLANLTRLERLQTRAAREVREDATEPAPDVQAEIAGPLDPGPLAQACMGLPRDEIEKKVAAWFQARLDEGASAEELTLLARRVITANGPPSEQPPRTT